MDEANLPKPTFKKQDFMTIATIRNNFIEDNVPKNVPINVPKKVTKKNFRWTMSRYHYCCYY